MFRSRSKYYELIFFSQHLVQFIFRTITNVGVLSLTAICISTLLRLHLLQITLNDIIPNLIHSNIIANTHFDVDFLLMFTVKP